MEKCSWISSPCFVAVFLLGGATLGLASAAPRQVPADSTPLETIRDSNRAILRIFAEGGNDPQTNARVYAIMEQVTDFGTMSDGAIQRFCADLSNEKCDEFKRVFTELLQVRAVTKAGRYKANTFDYLGEEIDGDEAVVSTTAHYKDDSINLVYELERAEGRWLIVNYIVDGVDTVRSHRKQFTRLLRKETVDDVIARLRRKIAEYQAEGEEK